MKTYNAEVYGYLFGSVLSVTTEELRIIAALSFLVLGTILAFSKEFYFVAFDQEMAEAFRGSGQAHLLSLAHSRRIDHGGVPENRRGNPGVCHGAHPSLHRLSIDAQLRHMTFYAAAIGTASSVGGVLLSYVWDVPTGPAIVLLATGDLFRVGVAVAEAIEESPYVIKKER